MKASIIGCGSIAVSRRTFFDFSSSFIACSFHVVIHELRRDTASSRSMGGHSMFGRSVCQLSAEQRTHMTCWYCVLIRRVSQLTKPPSCQPVPPLDHQVRALQQDLRTQPSLQRRRFSCVALCAHRGFLSFNTLRQCCAPRCPDANATRNIPQVVRTTEAVIVSIWKGAWVHKLNAMALIGHLLHVANVVLSIDFLPVGFFRSFPAPLSRLGTVCL